MALASGPTVRFDRLTIEEGLSQSTVSTILEDRQGFLWFGTADGLNRFDGYQFKVFRHDANDPDSIASNNIWSGLVDSHGIMWIGTSNGLEKFDPEKERFEHFKPAATHSLGHIVRTIVEDADGVLWIGSDGGLSQFDRTQKRFTHFKNQPDNANSLSNNQVTAVFVDHKGTLWVGTQKGLNRFDPTSNGFVHFGHQQDNPNSLNDAKVTAIYQDVDETLWVGTASGLNRFDSQAQNFQPLKTRSSDIHNISHGYITTLHQDRRGLLWIGTKGGLNQYDDTTGKTVKFNHHISNLHSLSNDRILSFFQDSRGLLWIGTDGGGLNKLDPAQSRFGHFSHQPLDPHSLSNISVKAFLMDSQGVLWVGTADGLNQYDVKTQQFIHHRHQSINPFSLTHNNINAIVEDSKGFVWVGTSDGLNRYDRTTGRFKAFKHQSNNPESISHNGIGSIIEDSAGVLWIATPDGLNRFANNTFTHFKHDESNPDSLTHNEVVIVFEDSKDTLWVGTYDGLNRFDAKKQRFIHFTQQEDDPNSLSHNNVMSIHESADGALWIGTDGGGLHQFDEKNGGFIHYREEQGLANNTVYGIGEDNGGALWLSTNKGLSRFNPTTHAFTNYDVNDGLQSNEYNGRSYYQSPGGELFFGGINGFNRFYGEQIKARNPAGNVVFTDFKILNKTVQIENEKLAEDRFYHLPKAINALGKMTLKYDQSLMSFEFSALDFSNPLKNQYAYQLQGFDDDWISTNADNRRATYTKLPSGDYTLRVKASNGQGVFGDKVTSIEITVLPPPWKTWWAYVIYCVLFATAVLGYVSYRIGRNKIRTDGEVIRALQQVDQLKNAFLANTSVQLSTPLNGIISLTESLRDGVAGSLPEKANEHLNMVARSSRRLAHLISNILDFSQLKQGSVVLKIRSIDLYTLTDVVLTQSKSLVGKKDLELVNAVRPEMPAVAADEDRLLQIIHNLVSNAIQFTQSGNVTVGASIAKKGVEISVSDSGIGISEDQLPTIFDAFEQNQWNSNQASAGMGLCITRQLVDLHGSNIEVNSTVEQGSIFSFTLARSGHKASKDIKVVNPELMQPVLLDEQMPIEMPTVETDINPPEFDGSGFKLLLVDDEAMNLQVLKNHLSLQHYQLVEATDGYQALQAIEQQGPFDLVVLDIMMPKLSGYEVCKKIREQFSVNELPVLFLTAKTQVGDLVQGFAVGANDHLTKPVTKHELLSRVTTHLKLMNINRNLEKLVADRTARMVAAQKKLVLADKLASLGSLMAGVAHEIKNPTHFVHASVENLEADLQSCQQFIHDLAGEDADQEIIDTLRRQFEPLYEHIGTIKDGTVRIKTIVKDLKASSYLDASEKQNVKLTDLLMSTVNLVRTNYKEEAQLITEFDAEPVLRCFPAKISQVFMNLIVNAGDALREKQREQDTKVPGQIVIGCRLIEKQIEITVKDDGNGMTDETKGKLFEPFYTTKRVGEGTGLGLSISHDIAQLHGGELTVESELGVGTVFRLTLPL